MASTAPSAERVHAPAKLNLSLAVLGRRSDGFHDIESLFVPLAMHDTLIVRRDEPAGQPRLELTVRYEGRPAAVRSDTRTAAASVPTDDSNLVVRAARALAAAADRERELERRWRIDLIKRIPAGAGLGGGSSDAAATIRALARMWKIDWSPQRLAEVGATVGSDVPWFFTAAPAIVRGRGERVELLPPIPSLAAVVACPREPLSTAAVYSEWSRGPGTGGDGDPVRLADALTAGRLRHARPLLVNDLEAPAGRLCPEIERLLMALRRAGALAPRLTGSGSACFALTRTAAEARAIAARLAAERGSDGSRRWPTAVATWVIGTPRA